MDKEDCKRKGGEIFAKVASLIKKGNVRRLIIQDKTGKILINIPINLVIVVTVIAPILTGFVFIFGLLKDCTFKIDREGEE